MPTPNRVRCSAGVAGTVSPVLHGAHSLEVIQVLTSRDERLPRGLSALRFEALKRQSAVLAAFSGRKLADFAPYFLCGNAG